MRFRDIFIRFFVYGWVWFVASGSTQLKGDVVPVHNPLFDTKGLYKISQSDGKFLSGKQLPPEYNYRTIAGIGLPTQCFYECRMDRECKSFTHNERDNSCFLNSKTFSEVTLVDAEASVTGFERDAFSIPEEALGLCAKFPCQNDGLCLDKYDEATEKKGYECVCPEGWSGKTCTTRAGESKWEEWKPWSACSVSCGAGLKERTRRCIDSISKEERNEQECWGTSIEIQLCPPKLCPVWSDWSSWSDCSTNRSCGSGIKTRTRRCKHGGKIDKDPGCFGRPKEDAPCESPSCQTMVRLDGSSTYGEGRVMIYNDLDKKWGQVCGAGLDNKAADVICHQVGLPKAAEIVTDSSFGTSNNPYFVGNFNCKGTEPVIQRCEHGGWANSMLCPGGPAKVKCVVNGRWNCWSAWSKCSVTCAEGVEARTRQCNEPPPLNGGSACSGDGRETRPCNPGPCPVDGEWYPWKDWSACTKDCGGGKQKRTRVCKQPKNGGMVCAGSNSEERECQKQPCPIDCSWKDWQAWGACNATCNTGYKARKRDWNEAQHNGKACEGESVEFAKCNEQPCPVDGVWLPWNSWGTCSLKCGGGQQNRKKECQGPFNGGQDCSGEGTETRSCNDHPCPVDGVWAPWSPWDSCTLSCGSGVQARSRQCDGPRHGGKPCVGDTKEEQACNTVPCPVDGHWQTWGGWTTCTATCGTGIQRRSRTCSLGKHGGKNCTGEAEESRECSTNPCPINGYWKKWGSWQDCSKSCGGGKQVRTRECVAAKHGGNDCVGPATTEETCNEKPCPVDGYWKRWGTWQDCSVSCGGGTRRRTRECVPAKYGGNDCTGASFEEEVCGDKHCPVNGIWQKWETWTECTVSCSGGERQRRRKCDGPRYGGQTCSGKWTETQACNTQNCPIDGVWTSWQSWMACTTTCGGGTKKRTRGCTGPKHNGRNCTGKWADEAECGTQPCPVDGMLTDWTVWSPCDKTCGTGRQIRKRTCRPAQHGGKDCEGDLEEAKKCLLKECPVDCVMGEWGRWGGCSVSCGRGTRQRSRGNKIEAKHNGAECTGSLVDKEGCGTVKCPVDGVFKPWSEWTTCPVSCGGGRITRTRDCDGPYHGGRDCSGPRTGSHSCNDKPCPVNGQFNQWQEWSKCSKSCGGGKHTRTRTCDGPYHGGKNCTGIWSKTEDCNTTPCPIPGQWQEWGEWSRCSTTCGGGQRVRKKECKHDPSKFMTLDCVGKGSEYKVCHEYICFPLARSCTEWKEKGMTESSGAEIDPDGRSPARYFWVYCDMEMEGGRGVTVLAHQLENATKISESSKKDSSKEFSLDLKYAHPDDFALNAFVKKSEACKQYISWKCYGSRITDWDPEVGNEAKPVFLTYWSNRHKRPQKYWGGAQPGSYKCGCGARGDCAKKGTVCNCDKNTPEWLEDSGYITNKVDLPITRFTTGDVGDSSASVGDEKELGYFFAGPLLCWGTVG